MSVFSSLPRFDIFVPAFAIKLEVHLSDLLLWVTLLVSTGGVFIYFDRGGFELIRQEIKTFNYCLMAVFEGYVIISTLEQDPHFMMTKET